MSRRGHYSIHRSIVAAIIAFADQSSRRASFKTGECVEWCRTTPTMVPRSPGAWTGSRLWPQATTWSARRLDSQAGNIWNRRTRTESPEAYEIAGSIRNCALRHCSRAEARGPRGEKGLEKPKPGLGASGCTPLKRVLVSSKQSPKCSLLARVLALATVAQSRVASIATQCTCAHSAACCVTMRSGLVPPSRVQMGSGSHAQLCGSPIGKKDYIESCFGEPTPEKQWWWQAASRTLLPKPRLGLETRGLETRGLETLGLETLGLEPLGLC